jgi:predicted MFS family arabinose efflux permease
MVSVLSLSFGTFALVTSELMPIGLLPKISASLGVTDGAAGMTITVPGFVAAFAAPALIGFSKHLDRRILLWITSVMLIVSDLLAASAGNHATLIAGRSLPGVSVGGFWAVGAATATRLVDARLAGRATAVVFAGISNVSETAVRREADQVRRAAGFTLVSLHPLPSGGRLGNPAILLSWASSFAASRSSIEYS